MVEQIVVNTGPLIALSRIDALEVIQKLPFEFVCPVAVREELDAGIFHGYPVIVISWIQILPLSSLENPIAKFGQEKPGLRFASSAPSRLHHLNHH